MALLIRVGFIQDKTFLFTPSHYKYDLLIVINFRKDLTILPRSITKYELLVH